MRHLRHTGSAASLCGRAGPAVHVSKARKTDCPSCRAEYRKGRRAVALRAPLLDLVKLERSGYFSGALDDARPVRPQDKLAPTPHEISTAALWRQLFHVAGTLERRGFALSIIIDSLRSNLSMSVPGRLPVERKR